MINNINGIGSLYPRYDHGSTPGNANAKPESKADHLPRDQVTLSSQARVKEREQNKSSNAEKKLEPEEERQISELKQRDAEVKAHEQAHIAAGGALVRGGAGYQYQKGPDGKMYAVGGEVSIDVSQERTPNATIRKMQQVRQAALAPAQPSGTDRAVAARATQVEAQARIQKNRETASASANEPAIEASPNDPAAISADALELSFQTSGSPNTRDKRPDPQQVGSRINIVA